MALLADLKTIAPDIVFWTGLVATLFKLVEIFFPAHVEKRITDSLTLAWGWLSYQRTWPYIAYFHQYARFRWFIYPALLIVLAFLSSIYINDHVYRETPFFDISTYINMFLIICIPVLAVFLLRHKLHQAFEWATSSENPVTIVVRSVLILAASYLLFAGLNQVFQNLSFSSPGWDSGIGLIVSMGIFVFAAAVFMVGFCFACVFLYITGVLIASALLYLLREFIRVLVEYEKGPVVAIAAIATAMGGLAKVML